MTIEELHKLPGALLWKASKLWQNNMHQVLADIGLASTNAIVLSNILRFELEGKKVTQAQMAAFCDIDKMTASTILRALVSKGMIRRNVHATDKRAFEFSLTPEGKKIAQEALHRIAQMHQKFFESLQEAELAQLVTGLTALLDANSQRKPKNHTKEGK